MSKAQSPAVLPPYLPEVQSLLGTLLPLAVQATGVRRFSIMLLDGEFRRLLVVESIGLEKEIASQAEVPLGERIAGWVALHQKPLLVQEEGESPLALSREGGYETPSFASVPILVQGQVYGVLNAADKWDSKPLSEDDLATMQLLATHLGVCIERSLLQTQVRAQANSDGLTSTYNHRYFHERLEEELARAKRHPRPVSLLLADLDNFKRFNDTYGHPTGDRILVEVADLLKDTVRATDILCRYGGDEFTAILPDIDAQGALAMARRIEKRIRGHPFTAAGLLPPQNLRVCTGISTFPALAKNKESLIYQADEALYWAKASLADPSYLWTPGKPPRPPLLRRPE